MNAECKSGRKNPESTKTGKSSPAVIADRAESERIPGTSAMNALKCKNTSVQNEENQAMK